MKSLSSIPITITSGIPWRYDGNDKYRYILEKMGSNPLVCIGANSSTAVPGKLDPTLKTVDRVSSLWGYDGFVMLNLSPIRATNPKDLPKEEDVFLYKENIEWIAAVLKEHKNVYCAWGNLIEIRPYMNIFRDFAPPKNVNWLCRGAVSKNGHPHHPLYVKMDAPLLSFPMKEYYNKMRGE